MTCPLQMIHESVTTTQAPVEVATNAGMTPPIRMNTATNQRGNIFAREEAARLL